MELAEDVYAFVRKFPTDERFGLSDQLRRAVVSVASNIAEGYGRETTKDFVHFISMARGSLYETSTQLELAERLWNLKSDDACDKVARVGMMLNALSTRLKSSMSTHRIQGAKQPSSPTSHEPRTTNHDIPS